VAGLAANIQIDAPFCHPFIDIQILHIKFHKDSKIFTLLRCSDAYMLSKTFVASLKELLKFRQHAEFSPARLQSRK